ncbi:AUTOIMMUNE REGULATOR [Salix purpurea]|uniref:AUTOIMMUNE REGULATOR n=1 Tax=Salix purpurea TaxID=77065 RepID=A0A9Q0T3W6_SALPP|nr:AUTOIMMUNE REGULATOR [Salix purpurea]
MKPGNHFLTRNKQNKKKLQTTTQNSEVSNPVIILVSPKDNGSSSRDISEESPTNACPSSEETLTVSKEGGSSSSEDNTSHQSPRNDSCDFVSMSPVVLEIPKHASTTGVRKITFKFSKRKEDYDTKTSLSHPLHDGTDRGLLYHRNEEYYPRNHSVWVDSCTERPQVGERYMELNMSKKVVPNNYPTNVKKLLATGILDRARVKYICFSSERELDGIIDGGGYLCGCSSCNFSKVLSAYEFEQHAGAKTRHPNNHIYLENGKPIYSIIQELKTAPLSIIDGVIKDVAGSSINEEFFRVWKANLNQSNALCMYEFLGVGGVFDLDKSCCASQALKESFCPISSSFLYNNNFASQQMYMETSGMSKQTSKRPSSYFPSSVTKQKKTAESGARKRDNDLHRSLFMPNGLPDGTELAYYVKGQKILGGYKQGNGIVCSCCEVEISPSQFESHAGMSARRQPYRHIYTSNGLTLHDIAISLVNGQNITTGIGDDMCAECGDGGDLMFCQSCPRAFHAACLDLQDTPEGAWHCPNCNKLGHEGNFGRPIVIRLTRVVKTPEYDVGGCVVCRAHDFSGDTFDDRTVILCDQCEKEFHVGCLRESGLCDLKEIPKDNWFCCQDCNNIYVALRSSVSTGVQKIPASLLNIINRKHVEKGLLVDEAAHDVQWQILMGKSRNREDLSLLSGAAAIFRECFDPIVAKTGRDLIPVMVYGRNISGQEFGGMYCVLLTVRHVVVSAGLLRIFGREVAELPLVATDREHQGKGYFQALFSCIERLLCSLNVEQLVLPAAEEAESIWTRRFGFRKMSEGQKPSRKPKIKVSKTLVLSSTTSHSLTDS